ncbi:MAG: AAA family ATPase [Candidatus Omnitrophica bacterium]|jgi:type II secretory pathway predicted ATPase ExeA|nr:AAA family ATPase [Candidatus Omnitrophota bacterium]MDD5078699.1 AAA family ATPase [Candidatus Omnitrophota bacterium]MDD5080240.1 AAA family ATPase [Candidatus Omnitrophota bacterium]
MYTSFWGLKAKPFENTPDPQFIYYSKQHKEAVARLLYVVREHKGAALFTGEYGSGKTLLSRVLWHELQQENRFQSVFILNPRLSGLEFIQEIVHQLSNSEAASNKIDLFHALHRILYANHNAGKHTVIIIDEAQAIQDQDIFEEIRLLLNFQLDDAFLLTIILIGQPELKYSVMSLPQFMQRLAVRYHLKALDENETKEYIRHRLKVGGATRDIFEEEALKEVYFCTSGTPRRINTICDLALLVGFGNGAAMIDKKTISKINEDLGSADFDVPFTNPASSSGVSEQVKSNLENLGLDSKPRKK